MEKRNGFILPFAPSRRSGIQEKRDPNTGPESSSHPIPITLSQNEGFRVSWKTSPQRKIRPPRIQKAYLLGDRVSSGVQEEISMVKHVYASLQSRGSSSAFPEKKLQSKLGGPLSRQSKRPRLAAEQGQKLGSRSRASSFERQMKVFSRNNNAKRKKRKSVAESNGIGVRTSKKSSSRVSLDELFEEFKHQSDPLTAESESVQSQGNKSVSNDKENYVQHSQELGREVLGVTSTENSKEAPGSTPYSQNAPQTSNGSSKTSNEYDIIGENDDDWALQALEETLKHQSTQQNKKNPGQGSERENATEKLSRHIPTASMSCKSSTYAVLQVTSKVTESGREKRFAVKIIAPTAGAQNKTTDDDAFSFPLIVRLRGAWKGCPIAPNDMFNVIWDPLSPREDPSACLKEARSRNEIIVDDDNHWLVLCPEILVSPSAIATASRCPRQAVLSSRYQDNFGSKHCTFGNLKHDLFEFAILSKKSSTEDLKKASEGIVEKRSLECFASNVSDGEALKALESFIPELQVWVSKSLEAHAPQRTLNQNVHNFNQSQSEPFKFSISDVIATEEDIISPMWGLRARPDASALVHYSAKKDQREIQCLVPLELKTGKAHQSHNAQASLYGLVFADRYSNKAAYAGPRDYYGEQGAMKPTVNEPGRVFPGAALLYLGLRNGGGHQLRMIHHKRIELKALVGIRNELVPYLSQKNIDSRSLNEVDFESMSVSPLPPVLDSPYECTKCFMKNTCALNAKTRIDPQGSLIKMKDEFSKSVGHLSEEERKYFRKWEGLLDLEDTVSCPKFNFLQHTHNLDVSGKSDTIEPLILVQKQVTLDGRAHTSKEFSYSFVLDNPDSTKGSPSAEKGFTDFGAMLSQGDKVSIGALGSHVRLSSAVVVQATPSNIVVKTDSPLPIPVGKNTNATGNVGELEKQVRWYIEKYVYRNGMKSSRSSIRHMMLRSPNRDNAINILADKQGHLRDLIVAGRKPQFLQNCSVDKLSNPVSDWWTKFTEGDQRKLGKKYLLDEISGLNVDQMNAFSMCMNMEDYAMVLGMPGTGKTTLVSLLVQAFLKLGKRVLLASFTNSAVDNMLMKLQAKDVDFVRIGNIASVHQNIRPFVLESKIKNISKCAGKVHATEHILKSTNLIGATCLSCSSALMQKLNFDVCIVDEASQMSEPVCLIPLYLAKKFVLVGDHNQLTALVKNRIAKKKGMAKSLFKRLSSLHPCACASLTFQYRMNKDIMYISNSLVYGGNLKCASEAVGSRKLQIDRSVLDDLTIMPPPRTDGDHVPGSAPLLHWLRDIVDPAKAVVFLNTDSIAKGPLESRTVPKSFAIKHAFAPDSDVLKGSLVNHVEASLVDTCVNGLLRCNVAATDIGVICPYRSQLSVLRSNRYLGGHGERLEIQTVDKYQGRDKPCIVISLVRSNTLSNVGKLLKDFRRINVAFTRAMCKLIIVGSLNTLRGSKEKNLQELVRLIEVRKWNYELPQKAHLFYCHYKAQN